MSPSTGFSGPERLYATLASGLLDRRVDLWGLVVRPGITAALLRPAHRERLIHDGIEFGHPTLASFDYCLRVFRRVRPDLIHCNGLQSWPVFAAADVCRVPVVQHVRIVDLAGSEEQLRRSHMLIAVSQFTAVEAVKAGADPDRMRVCYDGIDTGHFRRTAARCLAARRHLGIAPQAFVVLCIARCCRMKRIEVAIGAFADALGRRRSARLLVVGEIEDPLYYESLKGVIARYGLESNVRFLWAVQDIRAVHAAADALILPSQREALGTAILEAMAMETPVVASASGGIPEILDDSCGTLVDENATEQFGRALRRVAREDEGLARKARHARTIVKRRFDLDDHVEAIRRLYLELT